MMSRKIIAVAAVIVMFVLGYVMITHDMLLTENRSIVLVGYSKYSQKWIDIKEGAISSAEKQGINITAVACDSIHAVADQIQLIEQAIDERADAIIIMPTDLDQLKSTIDRAKNNNIDLIIIDNYQNDIEYSITRVGTSASSFAGDLVQDISKSKNGGIKIGCIFSYDDNKKSLAVYNEFVDEIEKYDNITIVTDTSSAIDKNVAGAATEVMLNTNYLDYIVCFEETITLGACEYLSKRIEDGESAFAEDTKIIGIGSVDDSMRFLEDSILYSLGVQSYYNMGYLAVQNYAETLMNDVYAAHYIIHKEDLNNEEYQKILFRIN